MGKTKNSHIVVETNIKASKEHVWTCWTTPEHIIQWNQASEDWHTPTAENDLSEGGTFVYRMEAKDGSMGFDFEGTYDQIIEHELITYTMPDHRKVKVEFIQEDTVIKVIEVFDADEDHSIDMQKNGWQAILDNFKRYVEAT